MRADAVGGNLAAVHQPLTFELVHAEQAATRIAGVVFGGVQPVAAVVNHRVTVEVPVRLRRHGLQQRAVTQVDQVALGAGAPGDKQRDRQRRVIDDVVAALADLGGKHPGAVQPISDGVMLAISIVPRRKQQRAGILLPEQLPAAQCHCSQQQTP
ncbi:hypothetical protein D3C86_1382970 [compost metagenome]